MVLLGFVRPNSPQGRGVAEGSHLLAETLEALAAEDRVRLQTGAPGHFDELDPERRALKELIEREDSRRAAQGFDEGAAMKQGLSPIRDPV